MANHKGIKISGFAPPMPEVIDISEIKEPPKDTKTQGSTITTAMIGKLGLKKTKK